MLGVGVVFIVVGVIWTGVALFYFRKGVATKRWATTVGRVERVEALRTYYAIQLSIAYEYEVGGRRYSSSRIGFGHDVRLSQDGLTAAYAPDRVARQEFGDLEQLPVFYDAANPRAAVLRRGAGPVLALLLVIGTATIALGVASIAAR